MSSKVRYKKGPNKPIFKFFSEKCVTKYCVLAGDIYRWCCGRVSLSLQYVSGSRDGNLDAEL